ncbi:SIS domain-containing protein [Gammaproteobacteria bacterium]|jgi:arabinose-5-phosphate isomerase|nr:SIS domain-containing protein [Gammaproteobacteria bacterium]
MKNFILEQLSEIDFDSLVEEVIQFIGSKPVPKIIFIGVGKTAYTAQRLTASFISMDIDCRYLHAADALHGDMGNIGAKDLCVFFSYSGETLEILELAKYLKSRHCKLLCVTNKAGSSLESLSNHSIFLNCSNGLPHFEKIPSISLYAFEMIFDMLLIRLCKEDEKSILDFSYNHPGGGIGSWFATSLSKVSRDISDISIDFDENILNISEKMDQLQTGIAFLKLKEKFIGCLTSGDVRRIIAKPSSELLLSDLNQTPIEISNSCSVQDALGLMKDKEVNFLFISDPKKQIIGYVLIGDLIK